MLSRLGLTMYEKRLISSIVTQGYSSVNYRDAMNIAQIPYGRVHNTLNSLKSKGFLEDAGGRPRQYKLRPIGEAIEEYIVKPLISDLFGYPSNGESTFRNIWVKEICSAVPVVRVNGDGAGEPITMLTGIDEIRKAQIRELMNATEEVLMCMPRGNFLDRRFSDYIHMNSNVRMEVIAPFTPKELMGHTFQSQLREVTKMLDNDRTRPRVHYFLNRTVKDRYMIIDNNFAVIGSDVSPVLVHMYSREHCAVLKEKFMEMKKYSREISLWPGSTSAMN